MLDQPNINKVVANKQKEKQTATTIPVYSINRRSCHSQPRKNTALNSTGLIKWQKKLIGQ
jgi:hypothetical protein